MNHKLLQGIQRVTSESVKEERTEIIDLAKHIRNYILSSLVPVLVVPLSTGIFTRVFTPEEYGRYSLVVILAGSLSMVASQWLQQSITRYLPGVKESQAIRDSKSAIVLSLILTTSLIGVFSVLSMLTIGRVLAQEWSGMLLAGIALVLATSVFNTLIVVLQAEMRSGHYSLYRLLNFCFSFGASLLLVFLLSRHPASLVWGNTIALIVLTPFIWRAAAMPSVSASLARFRLCIETLKRLVTYGVPMTGWIVAVTLLFFSDRYLIQVFRGTSEVGIYSASYVFVNGAVSMLATPLILAAHPFLMRAWDQGDRVATARWLGAIVELLLIAAVFLITLTTMFSKDLARLLLGPAFREGYRVMPAIVAGGIIWQLGAYVHKPLEFVENTRLMLLLAVCVTVLSISINLVLVPRFGYLAAAYTMLGSNVAYVVLAALIGHRILRWNIRLRIIVIFLITSVLVSYAVAIVRPWIEGSFGYMPGLALSLTVAIFYAGTCFFVLVRLIRPALLIESPVKILRGFGSLVKGICGL